MLMPLAMPATLRTIDIDPVYDGWREDFMTRNGVWTAVALLGLITGTAGVYAQSQPQAQPPMSEMSDMHKPAPPAGPLKITFGTQSAEWTPATLAALPHTTINVHNEHTKADETYSGVPLIDLLTKLGVPDKPRGKQFRIY